MWIPVVVMDGARVFGANESRAFVFDFGPGVSEVTYPPVVVEPEPAWRGAGRWRRANADSGLKRVQRGGPGFYVIRTRTLGDELSAQSGPVEGPR